MIRLLVVFGFACAGCAGASPQAARADSSRRHEGELALAQPDALGDHDCDAILDHAIALAEAEHPSEPPLSATERAHTRSELRSGFLAGCLELPRAAYRCALDATTSDALQACDPISR